ncbi:carbohydrate ABC transporter permease [Microbacterium ulmi]|uniref:Carbohydrate ABC transporter permease n=1 Tax=Microbacterium ulmi TaxID=179095 RepID=A0A7Y2M1U5_9MICO|nr:carbohydrate ABC transporter permease [Microbacterium ulmi]NII69261.1 multiple sugar transport system permease protein [Microbacterium ulmi]NNH04940.1 carbohydrate ABC transporter permease [Microbacterium ulmi]
MTETRTLVQPKLKRRRWEDPDAAAGNSFAGAKAGRFRRLTKHLLLIAVSLIMLYPVLWMLSSSFKEPGEIFTNQSLIPQTWTVDNYVKGWNALQYPFGQFFLNSTIVAVAAVVGNLFSCSLAAFAIARLRFKGSRVVLGIVLVSIMLPYHVVVVPQYIMFSSLGWVNTFWPLILPKFLATDAFFIFLMVQFIRALPRDLDEAARLDGCGPFGIYFRIILPLTTPALATTAIFTFIWSWNDFFTPLIYLTDPVMQTLPVALRSFLDSTGLSSYGPLFAMSILALGPIVGFFIVAQRYLIDGIATTGAKG